MRFFADTLYFRFFIPDTHFCRTIQVAAEADYGSPILALSNIKAYPGPQDVDESTVLNTQVEYNYAQAVIWVCPNANEYYDRGTYAVSVTAVAPTSFHLEVKVSSQTLPIPAPEVRTYFHFLISYPIPLQVRIACDSVPSSEYKYGNDSRCVEDGKTVLLSDVCVFSFISY